MMIFSYGEKELTYLRKKDKRLREAIDRIGMIEREIIPDLFAALINSIVGQQISTKAKETVWQRFTEKFPEMTPAQIEATPVEVIQQVGVSMRKANYIKGVAEAVVNGELNLDVLPQLSDEEVIAELSALKGIGIWSAEMLLIFSLQRPDVVSWGDLAIRRGIMTLYRHKELDRTRFERYRRRYSPYGSVASLYLWEIAAGR